MFPFTHNFILLNIFPSAVFSNNSILSCPHSLIIPFHRSQSPQVECWSLNLIHMTFSLKTIETLTEHLPMHRTRDSRLSWRGSGLCNGQIFTSLLCIQVRRIKPRYTKTMLNIFGRVGVKLWFYVNLYNYISVAVVRLGRLAPTRPIIIIMQGKQAFVTVQWNLSPLLRQLWVFWIYI